MTLSKEILDELLKGVDRPEDFFGDTGLMKELKIRLMERMLGAELTALRAGDARVGAGDAGLGRLQLLQPLAEHPVGDVGNRVPERRVPAARA